MTMPSPAIRGGPLLGLAIALAIAAPAGARDAVRHHYSVYGSLTPTTTSQSSGAAMQMQSRLSPAGDSTQSGGAFALHATLANAPTGCASDTIFENGFDP